MRPVGPLRMTSEGSSFARRLGSGIRSGLEREPQVIVVVPLLLPGCFCERALAALSRAKYLEIMEQR